MEVFTSLAQIPKSAFAVVTAGTFDGVHKGHRKILDQVTSQAKAQNGESYLLTYNPHPRLILQPDYMDLKVLTSLDEKLELLAETGLNYVVVLPFVQQVVDYGI